MAQDDVDLVRLGYEDFYRGDFTALLRKVDPNVVTERVAPLPDPGIYEGHEGMLQSLADWTEDFDDFQMRAEEVIDVDRGVVVVRIHQRARGKGSGVEVEGDFWFVHESSDGKLVRLTMFTDREQAFKRARQGG